MTVLPLEISSLRAGMVLLSVFGATFGLAYPYAAKVATEHGLNLQITDATIRGRTGEVLATALSGAAEERPGDFWGPIYQADTRICVRASDGPACAAAVAHRIARLRRYSADSIPPELLGFNDSPLRPDMGLASAMYQVPRIAAVRGIPQARIIAAVRASIRNSIFNTTRGIYVNRLELNLKLDGKLS